MLEIFGDQPARATATGGLQDEASQNDIEWRSSRAEAATIKVGSTWTTGQAAYALMIERASRRVIGGVNLRVATT